MNIMNIPLGPIWKKVQEQGVAFLLLLAVAYHFQMQNNVLQEKVDLCNSLQRSHYEAQLEYMRTIISNNTRALDQNSAIIKAFQQPKK